MNWDQVEELELFVIRCIRPWTNDNYSSWHIVKIPFQSSKEYQYPSQSRSLLSFYISPVIAVAHSSITNPLPPIWKVLLVKKNKNLKNPREKKILHKYTTNPDIDWFSQINCCLNEAINNLILSDSFVKRYQQVVTKHQQLALSCYCQQPHSHQSPIKNNSKSSNYKQGKAHIWPGSLIKKKKEKRGSSPQ